MILFLERALRRAFRLLRFHFIIFGDKAIQQTHAVCEAAICYTGDILDDRRDKYSLEYYVRLARELEQMGAHFIAIKDMAGLCRPYAAYKLVKALKEATDLPVHFHTHDTSGIASGSVLRASDAGVDIVDLAIASMSGSTAQPNLNSVVAALQHTERDTGLDLDALNEISDYWEQVRTFYAPFDTAPKSGSAEVYLHEMPGGQYTNLKEQATAMAEITTTISELLATAKQIAESARRVSGIAVDTADAAVSGDQLVQRTKESIEGIQRQVDLIVSHMLDLGRKSQQIGGILELINELAEQTNILAINATIEAAGAGESGKRFAVVGEEIRRLADRVGASTKEIRQLIDDIRTAVNKTVMTTEGGNKAVEAGARQFTEVATGFTKITSMVTTTNEAAREIELSTKQQSTAVEQVNVAVANVAQATKETEASSGQILQTASELVGLSRQLTKIVHVGEKA